MSSNIDANPSIQEEAQIRGTLIELRNRLYYRVKPWIPERIRFLARSAVARWKLPSVKEHWPVSLGSEKPPLSWQGWPDGKEFALVLTHDVESCRGVVRCRDLMRVEEDLGFRSSFNFIPEGQCDAYQRRPRRRCPSFPSSCQRRGSELERDASSDHPNPFRELRAELAAHGFEVGVHDLKHDGKLYSSRDHFRVAAEKINRYLVDWGAQGFRSAFMLHNLEWLHDLEVLYDASTFDTDPFEPQPDGVNTIFPFIRRSKATGAEYVELPYTLPQDSTLFLVLQEKTSRIWREKLDWIAKHGGMALINVHPDYTCFTDPCRYNEYPVARYVEFLDYVKEHYAGRYYHCLPRQMAELIRGRTQPV